MCINETGWNVWLINYNPYGEFVINKFGKLKRKEMKQNVKIFKWNLTVFI